jgi:hypothetical protein
MSVLDIILKEMREKVIFWIHTLIQLEQNTYWSSDELFG